MTSQWHTHILDGKQAIQRPIKQLYDEWLMGGDHGLIPAEQIKKPNNFSLSLNHGMAARPATRYYDGV
jgi:hypothetical protein